VCKPDQVVKVPETTGVFYWFGGDEGEVILPFEGVLQACARICLQASGNLSGCTAFSLTSVQDAPLYTCDLLYSSNLPGTQNYRSFQPESVVYNIEGCLSG
jgi:hypothetical protein